MSRTVLAHRTSALCIAQHPGTDRERPLVLRRSTARLLVARLVLSWRDLVLG